MTIDTVPAYDEVYLRARRKGCSDSYIVIDVAIAFKRKAQYPS